MALSVSALSYKVAYLTAAWLAYSPPSIVVTDRPVHLIVLTLICSSILLLLGRRCVTTLKHNTFSQKAQYESLPLQELQDDDDNDRGILEEAKENTVHGDATGICANFATVSLTILVLTFRIEVHRRILRASECSTRSVEVFLPFLLSIYDAVCIQRSQNFLADQDLDTTAYEDFTQSLKSSWLSSRWRYVPPAFILSLGCYLVAGLWLNSQSNYICPLLGPEKLAVPRLQLLALFLDAYLVVVASGFASESSQSLRVAIYVPRSWIVVMVSSSVVWTTVGVIVYRTQPENVNWLLFGDDASLIRSFLGLVFRALYLGIFCVSILLCLSQSGPLHTVMALAIICTGIPGLRFLWSSARPYPPVSSTYLTWSFVMVYIAWSLYSRIRRRIDLTEPLPSMTRRVIVFLAFIVLIFPGLIKNNTVHFHPIDLLMYNAQKQHLDYLNVAARSKNLKDAVQNYQGRYHENPPPGFDVWFDYARNRTVWVTDEFDQIYQDLLPFRSIPASDIRQQTWEDVSNPWNEISGITIRNGEAKVQDNVLPTHRWMLEGIVEIIKQFSQHLPDMDLGFNLNDECRVAVSYDHLQTLQRTASTMEFGGTRSWSNDRAIGWRDIPPEPISDTVYENWSFRNTFLEWGTTGCPASPLTRQPLSKSQICIQCASEHSMGQFLANWSVAADPCHQPDLAHLHGLYLSPAAFKATHRLRPVFSQSKVHGYNDILYPSAWNYLDKATYAPRNSTGTPGADDFVWNFPDPPFPEKENLLYWRGATSEGVSDGHGAWRGMARQRMVHMADNSTTSEHDNVVLLLPNQKHPEQYTYVSVSGTSISLLGLYSSVHFVDSIARCGGVDCLAQEQEFALVPPADFQTHWRYKYLMDLDGAGFSGRFLPFLRSRSLPFKSALFREWYDSRLVPWLHFVPQDIRLHGLWSTLAYFAGIQGVDDQGRTWNWKGHEREAIVIAEGGREWADRALTKADMEVYMFRLLLEWGRLTDDNRENLGYSMG